MGKKITIREVAEQCNVSTATVSRALNGTGYIREGLRRKILNRVEDLGWHSNNLTSRLNGRRSEGRIVIVGASELLLAPETSRELFVISEAVYKQFRSTPALKLGHRAETLAECRKSSPEAIILCGINEQLEEPIRDLVQLGIRVVAVGESLHPPCAVVHGDYVENGRKAAETLVKLGHRRIGFFGGFGSRPHLREGEFPMPRRVRDTVMGIRQIVPDFNFQEDAVSDCFGDLSAFGEMLESGMQTGWIVQETKHFLEFTATARQFGLFPPTDRPVVALLESTEIPVPPLACRFLYRDFRGEVARVVDALSGKSLPAEEYLIPYREA
ncbi:MAG: LacI family DNA-binding transcriptional regulator [Victivallaceae bacterium]|nr:LacI family DNA-binding transcriptional regulator [Victivallaceae bacterium]